VQFWTGEREPFYDGINKGAWQTFPTGTITDGQGGTPTLKLMSWRIPVRYLRIWMTESSDTCDTHGAQDKRNCVGYAINELYIGTVSEDGQFADIIKHVPSRQQTITWPSSVDPWHAASDLDYGRGDQIGFDFFFNCGVTRGLHTMIPIRVPCVGTLIGIFWAIVVRLVRGHVNKDTFGHVAATHILINENEGFLFCGYGRAHLRLVVVRAVRSDVVRGSLHDDRIRLGRILGNVDRRKQTYAIAHGNSVLVFGVVRQSVRQGGTFGLRERFVNQRLGRQGRSIEQQAEVH
jgi:hypothetical protein